MIEVLKAVFLLMLAYVAVVFSCLFICEVFGVLVAEIKNIFTRK